jgi:hypothetical protein
MGRPLVRQSFIMMVQRGGSKEDVPSMSMSRCELASRVLRIVCVGAAGFRRRKDEKTFFVFGSCLGTTRGDLHPRASTLRFLRFLCAVGKGETDER